MESTFLHFILNDFYVLGLSFFNGWAIITIIGYVCLVYAISVIFNILFGW